MTDPKEPRMLELAEEPQLESYWEQHLSHHTDEPIIGEASPTYLFVPQTHERIAEYAPRAKLVVILRDPIERAYSDWWMYYSRGIETRSFSDAVEENLELLDEEPDRFVGENGWKRWRALVEAIQQKRCIVEPFYLDVSQYAIQLEMLRSQLDQAPLHILFLEDLRARPEDTLGGLFEFLSLDPPPGLAPRATANRALGAPPRPVLAALRLAQRARLTTLIPKSLKRAALSVLSGGPKRPAMPEDVRTQLRGHFKPQDHALESLVERSLPWRWER